MIIVFYEYIFILCSVVVYVDYDIWLRKEDCETFKGCYLIPCNPKLNHSRTHMRGVLKQILQM